MIAEPITTIHSSVQLAPSTWHGQARFEAPPSPEMNAASVSEAKTMWSGASEEISRLAAACSERRMNRTGMRCEPVG
jgi:hypothetical protein